MNLQNRLLLSYLAQMGLTATLLLGATVMRRHFAMPAPAAADSSPLLSLLVFFQVALIWVFFLIVYRTYRRLDEMQKLMLLKIIATGAGTALCLAGSYMLLRPAFHLPDLPMLYAPWILCGCWVAIMLGGSLAAAMRDALHRQ